MGGVRELVSELSAAFRSEVEDEADMRGRNHRMGTSRFYGIGTWSIKSTTVYGCGWLCIGIGDSSFSRHWASIHRAKFVAGISTAPIF